MVRQARVLRPPSVAPTDQAAVDAVAVTVLNVSQPISRRRRQCLTGVLAWATCQHRLALPFMSALHRWAPLHAATPPQSVVDAANLSALIAVVPWRGEGFVELPLDSRPVVFFDGVASRSRATAAAYFAPDRAVAFPLPVGSDQQHAELAAAVLAVYFAVYLGLRLPVFAGDSTSALGALRKMSCPARCPERAALLQDVAWAMLSSGIGGSLAHVPGECNPADPISRAQVSPSGALLISASDLAVAARRARSCRLSPAAAVLRC